MGLGSFEVWKNSPLDKHTYLAADEVISNFHTKGEVAPEYRALLLAEYIDLAGCPAKRDGNGTLRSPEQSRLDRAWTRVAQAADRSEGDIRSCVLSVYDNVDLDAAIERAKENDDDELLREAKYYKELNKTDWLREDFDEILELAARRRQEDS